MLYQQAKCLKQGMWVKLIETEEVYRVDKIVVSNQPPIVMIYGRAKETGQLRSFDHRKAMKMNPLDCI